MKTVLAVVLGLGPALIAPAIAQDWPQKPVRDIVPFAPGSTPDIFARVLSTKLNKRVGQPFIVENKPGGGGMNGTDVVAKAPPDGYTIGVSITGPLVNNKLLYKTMPYDPEKDLAPITLAVNQPSLLVAKSELKVSNFQELVAELKKKPGKFNYASIGNGSLSHLCMELIALRSGTEVVHVPYPGSSQAILSVTTGEVDMACLPALSVLPQVKAGKLKVIAATTAKRSSLLPDIPTLAEQGLAGIESGAWIGVVAPAKTPRPVLAQINKEIVAALKDPEVTQALRNQMMEVVANTPSEFAADMRKERERWTPVIVKNKIAID
jgi:tripartite-type tricarboxylate transporter receptor subunit TctC